MSDIKYIESWHRKSGGAINHVRLARHALVLSVGCCLSMLGCTSYPIRGDGKTIEGAVISIDNEHHRLNTNIPSKWMMAPLDDKSPLVGRKPSQSESVFFELFVGGIRYPAMYACFRGPFRDGDWIVDGGYFPDLGEAESENARIYLEVMSGDAVKISGASVGTPVRMVKISEEEHADMDKNTKKR